MARERHEEQAYKRKIANTEENSRPLHATEVSAGAASIFGEYVEQEKMKEYLIDGAILKCSNSTLLPFQIKNKMGITLINIKEKSEEEKEERERTRLYVRKADGKMEVEKSHYATVLDCKKGELSKQSVEEDNSEGPNIYPFRCNCKVGVDKAIEEIMIKTHIEECRENGVCQYLMELNDTWENWPSEQRRFYEKRLVKVPIETEDGRKEFSVDAECISMTSMLFCKHGGLITPVDSGQVRRIVEEVFFTIEELRTCGWETITTEEAFEFNLALLGFGVTTRASACMLLATMLSESTNCSKVIEGQDNEYNCNCDSIDGWASFQENTFTREYTFTERGAGYIQLTWRDTHRSFLEDMSDPCQEENTARYIAANYPIEASVWYWTTFHNTEEGNLNEYVNKHGGSTDTFLVVQYYVNGFQNAKEHMKEIQDGKYKIRPIEGSDEEAEVIINGVIYDGPHNLQTRIQNWEKVKGLL